MKRIIFVIVVLLFVASITTAYGDIGYNSDALCQTGELCAEWMDRESEMYLLCNGDFSVYIYGTHAMRVICHAAKVYLPIVTNDEAD